MKMFIKKIILWPKDSKKKIREIEFEPGKINIVSGVSGTGKSAIVYIVDYCLGSSKCAIPIGKIREKVSWFGLLLELESTEMLLARREPAENISSTEYFIHESSEGIVIPKSIRKTDTIDGFKTRMNELAGLPDLKIDINENNGKRSHGRPSFRDMAAFNFLPQHIVANPYTLFFKADTTEHRDKLRAVFPLVLGAVDVNVLSALSEKNELDKSLKKLEAEYEHRVSALKAWEGQVKAFHLLAQELGLLPVKELANLEAYIKDLRMIPEMNITEKLISNFSGGMESSIRRVNELKIMENTIARELALLRWQQERIEGVLHSTNEYRSELLKQSERFVGNGWFADKLREKDVCPLCRSLADTSLKDFSKLKKLASELAQETNSINEPKNLNNEISRIKIEIRDKEDQIRQIRIERIELQGRKNKFTWELETIYRFSGRIEQALQNLEETSEESALKTNMKNLKDQIEALLQVTQNPNIAKRKQEAMAIVSENLSFYADFLKLERSDNLIKIREKELTIEFSDNGNSRTDLLWEVGSGANWMGYHMATSLALHEFFLQKEENPVPTFMIIDQPSQVYFPSNIEEEMKKAGENPGDKDYIATRKIFEVLAEGLERMEHKIQIIVLEHADEPFWNGVPGVVKKHTWRGDVDYLIPREW